MPSPKTILRGLAEDAFLHGSGRAEAKAKALTTLEGLPLRSAREVRTLHELACFLRAYPDDADVRAAADRLLARFAERRDLRKHRGELESSGIAGTAIAFRFFAPTALRLARRFGDRLKIDWRGFDAKERLARLLPMLALEVERPAFDDPSVSPRAWIERYRGALTDATFLSERVASLEASEPLRSALYDDLDPPLVLTAGPETPCRTREIDRSLPVVYQSRPLDRQRPNLASEIERAPASVTKADPRRAAELIEAARNAMLPRERDLEVFAYGNPDDVRLVDVGDGLVLAAIGVIPERRCVLEAVLGFLMIKNGVSVGYSLASALFCSSEIAYNVFETFRRGETASMFGRVLATAHHLYGSRSFAIDPYQLGDHNREGLASGAFWFYQKLGFGPRDEGVQKVLDRELAKMKRSRSYRSDVATLKKLARAYALYSPDPPRMDVLGVLSPARVALRASRLVCERYGGDRAVAERAHWEGALALLREAGAREESLGPAERLTWRRWAGLIPLLEIETWSSRERCDLVEIVMAKAAPSEDEFVRRFDAHRRLRERIALLAAPAPPP